jgi:hypothetical protein
MEDRLRICRFPGRVDRDDDFPAAAGYVDRILKGEKLADLRMQAPVRFELVIKNLKIAEARRFE